MNMELRKLAKDDFENDFFKLMINTLFGKTMENLREQRDINFATTENYLVLEPNYHTTKFFPEHLLATEMKKTQIIMDKSIYLVLPILDISKTKMYDFWFDYLKPKYNEKVKLCYMDADSFIVHMRILFILLVLFILFISTKILQKMLKKDSTLHIIM